MEREVELQTKRLLLYPLSDGEMEHKIKLESDDGMKQAYSEMLQGCTENPEQRIWYAIWNMELNDGSMISVGDFSFKGLGSDGVIEIGYGVKRGYERQGYMTEAVIAVTQWALQQPKVHSVEAETELQNHASKRVLEKAGFRPNGIMGQEGPRYVLI